MDTFSLSGDAFPVVKRLPALQYAESHHDLESASLNRSASHLNAAKLERDEAVAHRKIADVARWLIENREQILEQASRTVGIKAEFPSEVTITANKKGLGEWLA